MLPGFRFLFAAIVLSTSMLIFGLGAAALLRAAHQEFASIPLGRAPAETLFAPRNDAGPTLALARIEPPDADQKAATTSPAPEESAKESDNEPEKDPDQIAALIDAAMPAMDSLLSEAPEPEASTSEIPVQAETPAQTGAPSSSAETKLAAIAEMTSTAPDQAAVTAPDQQAAPVEDSTRIAENRIATLGGPPVTIETQTPSKIGRAVVRKFPQVKRVVKRHKVAQRVPRSPPPPRARVTQQAPRMPVDPFARPFGFSR